MPFVLDNSVVAGWFLEDQSTPYTEAIAALVEEDRAVVPLLWQLEFANVLRTVCKRKRIVASRRSKSSSRFAACQSRLIRKRPGLRNCWPWRFGTI